MKEPDRFVCGEASSGTSRPLIRSDGTHHNVGLPQDPMHRVRTHSEVFGYTDQGPALLVAPDHLGRFSRGESAGRSPDISSLELGRDRRPMYPKSPGQRTDRLPGLVSRSELIDFRLVQPAQASYRPGRSSGYPITPATSENRPQTGRDVEFGVAAQQLDCRSRALPHAGAVIVVR